MADAVIVSTARTPIGRAYRGAFNNTHGATLAGHVIASAVQRAGIEPGEVEDVILGCALPEGATGQNIARQAALRAGLPVTTGGVTVNRFCSSGMQAIAMAAQRVIVDRVPIMAAGGVESISLVQNEHFNNFRIHEPWLDEHKPEVYMPMIETAEVVAKRYYVTREVQDEYALASQQRTAAGQKAGRFDAEIVPLTTKKLVQDKATGETREEEVTLAQDEGNRPDTTLAGLAALKPVMGEKGFITAGNASQLSDGASACIVMDASLAEQRNLKPLGIFRGYTVAACEPDEMGIGPVFAVPRLLERFGLKMDQIDLWELNEAFAVQVVYCRDRLGIPDGPAERGRRSHLDRSSVRDVGLAHGRPRPHRGQAAGREVRRLHHVHRRRDGGGGALRGRLMHVGLAAVFQNPGRARSDFEVYRGELRLADLAEPLGFESVWGVEHHFTDYTMCPDVLQFLTYMAGRTERIQLGSMVVVLPWHDPMRVAEEIAMLDNISGGRLILGLGRGAGKVEFDGFRQSMDESRPRFVESAQMLLRGLETGFCEYDGTYVQQPRADIRPAPFKSFRGRTYAAAVSPESARIMAELGVGILIIPQKPWAEVARSWTTTARCTEGSTAWRLRRPFPRAGPSATRARTGPASWRAGTSAAISSRCSRTTGSATTTSSRPRATSTTAR